MQTLWNVELHSHTRWSKDSVIPFETIIKLCRARGVHKIAITDHNTADGALAMHKLAPDLVIVAEEIMTTQGELLGYFLKESIPAGLTPNETIGRLREQGAAISVAHPFDRLRKGAWHEGDLRQIMDQVDAIEIFNARCIYPADNARAIAFAEAHNLLGTVGSDAHNRAEYGRAVTVMSPFEDAEGFVESLRTAQSLRRYSSWFVHLNSKTAKWSKKMGLRARLWDGG
ncbi:MAG: PHP domain-containing protein [Chloroflexota bacterium]|nr:PHP domain-containing protein [Chloroflexota bacterium]